MTRSAASQQAAPERPRTLFEKIWQAHVIEDHGDGTVLLWVDRHILNEGTSIQAFDALRERGLPVARAAMHTAVADHVVPTINREQPVGPGMARDMIEGLERNCADFGVPYIPFRSADQGICHVIAPQMGLVLPGMVAVCGDSHTSTLGALGAIAFGIGTTEMAHVMATGTLVAARPRMMAIEIGGVLSPGVTAKDLILAIIGQIGTAGATGHAIEFRGTAVAALDLESRLTLCNMAIEAGARSGIIAPDDTCLAYLEGRRFAPSGGDWQSAMADWRSLASDPGAHYDSTVRIDAASLAPQVSWGTSPQHVLPVTGAVPSPGDAPTPEAAAEIARALAYQGLAPGTPIRDIRVDQIFIGSCTNSRLSDLRHAAAMIGGRKLAAGVRGFVSPGSTLVKQQAEAEALDRLFIAAGFEWRSSACSMCCGGDAPAAGTRVAATSNRNFEHRQGRDVRTHLVSPAMAVACGIAGHFVDIRDWTTHG
jgi:3-isopropylmalate/(R)-2-methylmalate dehydratase large subunit